MAKQLKIKILLLLLLPLWAGAQYLEIGATGGGSQFLGDVGPYRPDIPRGYSYGGFFRYTFDNHWAVRFQGNYGFIQADDSRSSLEYRRQRNLSFQSKITEAYVSAEFNFFNFEPGTDRDRTPYLFAGFGVFWFNPQTEYQGETYNLRELRTEGQRTSANQEVPYGLGSSFFLMGFGYKWALNRQVSMGIETGWRSTYTDYLDDVSGFYADPAVLREEVGPISAALADRSLSGSSKENRLRGNPANNDWYIFTGITLQVKFSAAYEKCRAFLGDY